MGIAELHLTALRRCQRRVSDDHNADAATDVDEGIKLGVGGAGDIAIEAQDELVGVVQLHGCLRGEHPVVVDAVADRGLMVVDVVDEVFVA